jgi:outer membrane protein TolC
VVFVLAATAFGSPAYAQPPTSAPSAPSPAGKPSATGQTSAGPPATPNISGAFRKGDLSTQPLPLSLDDALTRGLANNIGLFISGRMTDEARAARVEELSNLLPKLDATLRESRQKANLAALGISVPLIPETVEYSNFDVRASVSASVFDLHELSNTRAASKRIDAAHWDATNTRELVVLAIATAYLQAVSAEAAVDTADANHTTADALFRLAQDRERSGVSPEIDTLRAQVELQDSVQAQTIARNTLDKERVALLRIIGLPLAQPLVLTTRMPYKPMTALTANEAVTRAIAGRADLKAADAQVAAAEAAEHAAALQRVPTVVVNGDFGALGTNPSNTLATWSATGLVRLPVFDGERIRADVEQASAALAQRTAERDDLKIAIEQDVSDALLDVTSDGQEVDVAQATVQLAQRALTQAQDRFTAGVTNNIEVIQAQEALVRANTQYVSALEAHNLAKLLLARAMGSVEQMWKDVLAQ